MCKHREGCQRASQQRRLQPLPYILISTYYCQIPAHTHSEHKCLAIDTPPLSLSLLPCAPPLANYKSSNQFHRIPVQGNGLQWHALSLYLAATWTQAGKWPASFQCLQYRANKGREHLSPGSRWCTADNLRPRYTHSHGGFAVACWFLLLWGDSIFFFVILKAHLNNVWGYVSG